ncbi:hypothetical protein Cgig2_002590 [Carnegiea gigantea]|uniref:Uncharacterized protein n=1 Tax=Carnegiea gigantea TaxID=171969 RepID=A0A9Q1JM46_9CARY|nr:hypothetical protein Cgig2_002590 [Carnegiea gigantea]
MAPKKRLKSTTASTSQATTARGNSSIPHRLTANYVFHRTDSQNEVRGGELFFLWVALNRKAVNTGAFIADHLNEHAKYTKVVISDGGIITALAKALGYGTQVAALSILHQPGYIDLITYINMKLFKVLGGGQLWLNHHGRALFPLPNRPKTTITNPSNLVYDDDVDGESGGESDGGGDDGSDDDVKNTPQGPGARLRAPVRPDAAPSGTATAPTSGAMGPSMFQTVLDRLDQLHVQNQEILRNQQNMAHLAMGICKRKTEPSMLDMVLREKLDEITLVTTKGNVQREGTRNGGNVSP